MTWTDLGRMRVALREVYRELAFTAGTPEELEGLAVALLEKKQLNTESIVEEYTRPFSETG